MTSQQSDTRKNYTVRLSPAEKAIIDLQAEEAGTNFSNYIRQAVLQKKVKLAATSQVPQVNREAYAELGKIAQALNSDLSQKGFHDSSDIQQLSLLLQEVRFRLLGVEPPGVIND